jgi:hypothetical protein
LGIEGMSMESFAFSPEFLANRATHIVNEVIGINRVAYRSHRDPSGGSSPQRRQTRLGEASLFT